MRSTVCATGIAIEQYSVECTLRSVAALFLSFLSFSPPFTTLFTGSGKSRDKATQFVSDYNESYNPHLYRLG